MFASTETLVATYQGTHPRFRVHAYICGAGCIKQPDIEGWALFGDIFFHRPNDCRYAVVESHAVSGAFEVWDFYCDALTTPLGFSKGISGAARKHPPEGLCVDRGDNVDALIMKAIALYGKE